MAAAKIRDLSNSRVQYRPAGLELCLAAALALEALVLRLLHGEEPDLKRLY
jgi:hypothetical protein